MAAVFTVLLVLALSLVIVRVATVGLTMTGVSRDLAQFQALSAFTGCGFTTKEAEDIVNHPLRRRITMHLMLLGHAGIAVGITSGLLSFMTAGDDYWTGRVGVRMGVLIGGVLLLWLLAASKQIERFMWRINTIALQRWTGVHVHDFTRLLRLSRNYVVSEIRVVADDWLVGRTLMELELNREGILVLGIERNTGEYIGTPRGTTMIAEGDLLILYGKQENLLDLDARQADIIGNLRHVMAVTRQSEEDAADGRTPSDLR